MSEDKKDDNNGWVEVGAVVRELKRTYGFPAKNIKELTGIPIKKTSGQVGQLERGGLTPSINEDSVLGVHDWEIDYLELDVNSKHYPLIRDAYDRFRKKYHKQPNQHTLWANIMVLCPEYNLVYENDAYFDGAGYMLAKKTYRGVYSRAFQKMLKKQS